MDSKVVPEAWTLWFDREAASAAIDVRILFSLIIIPFLRLSFSTSPTIASTGLTFFLTGRVTTS